jgi:MerR family transcriptional regulator, light-induced transcriptional regulator
VVQRSVNLKAFSRDGPRAFFAPSPGEQHVFGLVMLQEFFDAEGWRTTSDLAATNDEILRIVEAEEVDLVGLTVSQEELLEPLAHLISRVRKASRNSKLLIMVGGRILNKSRDYVDLVGANATAPDGRLAVDLANTLIREATCAVHKA